MLNETLCKDFLQHSINAQSYFCYARSVFGGGPKWTRTTDLTIISRVL